MQQENHGIDPYWKITFLHPFDRFIEGVSGQYKMDVGRDPMLHQQFDRPRCILIPIPTHRYGAAVFFLMAASSSVIPYPELV